MSENQAVGAIPRRIRMDQWTDAERAIHDAVQAVEEAGAHPLLTDAVNLLAQARERVADYVDCVIARAQGVVAGGTAHIDNAGYASPKE